MAYCIVRHGSREEYAVLDQETNRLVVEHESMGVCDGVLFALTHPRDGWPSEAGEIAASIRLHKA